MLYAFFALLLAAAPLAGATTQIPKTKETKHQRILTDELKSLYDQKKRMVVLDARSITYFDGKLLPKAKWVPAESTEKEIQAAIPSIESLVIVYCYNVECPASRRLFNKLALMGYKNIYEYQEGIQEWTKRGYPTTKNLKTKP